MAEAAEALALVLCTVPDEAAGRRIAGALVEERLIACANLVPGLTSVYRWEGEVRSDSECLLLMKTRRALLERLFERARELHPYELPELIATPVVEGLADYCRWVADETSVGDAGAGAGVVG